MPVPKQCFAIKLLYKRFQGLALLALTGKALNGSTLSKCLFCFTARPLHVFWDGVAEDGRQLRGDHDLDPDQEKWTKGQDLLFRLSESSNIKLDQEKDRI